MARAYGETKVWGTAKLTRLCTTSWPLSCTKVSVRTSPPRRTRMWEKADTSSCSSCPRVRAGDIDQTTSAAAAASKATARSAGAATLRRCPCRRLDSPLAVPIAPIMSHTPVQGTVTGTVRLTHRMAQCRDENPSIPLL